MSDSNLVLPYAMEGSDRKTRFSESIEVASLLCIAEAERKKKTGFFRGAVETVAFLSKLHYPLWAIPQENDCLLIDGMGIVSDYVLYGKPPDVEAFIEHLKRSSTVEELYHSALRSHIETFSRFTSQTEIPMEGLITDKELLSDMLAFIKDSKAKMNCSALKTTSLILPKINKESAVEITGKVLEHYNKLHSEIKGLQFAIDTVDEETEKHLDKLRQELEQTREKYEDRISDVKVEVEKRKEELERERDEKIEKITASHEKETNSRFEERRKWEQELLRLEQSKSEYEKRRELRKRKNDEVGEARWNARLRDVQNQISTVKGKVRTVSDFINRSNKETEKTTKNLYDTYQKLIDEEEKKITDLESLCDSEMEKREKEVKELRQETKSLTDKIEKLIEQKKERSLTIKEGVIPWKIKAPTLIHVPFYLIQYTAEKEKRYRFRPPVVARGRKGLVMKIRSLVKRANVNTLLKPRSKALERMVNSFKEELKGDKGLQRHLSQLGLAHNLLASADFKEKVKAGMEELEVEGWIKPEEKTLLLDIYVAD